MRSQPQTYFDDVEVGQEITPLMKNCTTRQLVMWAAASSDFYEIHYDQQFAASAGLPGLVVHGALKNAFLGNLLHNFVRPDGRVLRFGCSYRGMDYPNQEMTCRGVIRRKYQEEDRSLVELEIWVENAERKVTTPGSALVTLPTRSTAES